MEQSPVRYFYDTEFVENGHTIDLVAIGVIAAPAWALEPTNGLTATEFLRANARTYYAVNADVDLDALKGNDWLVRNVLPHLPVTSRKSLDDYIGNPPTHFPRPGIKYVDLDRAATEVKPRWVIANEVRDFLLAPLAEADEGESMEIELWADYGAYDHVALAQLWGPMIALPPGIPMFTNDLQQLARAVGMADYRPDQAPEDAHNALADAWYALDLYAALTAAQNGS